MLNKKKKIRIYLGDLGHFTTVLTNNVTPINIGFIGAFLKKHFKDKIEIRLFKNPQALIDAIYKETPHILGLSNYVWNHSISDRIIKLFKKIQPEGTTIWGGPHFPINEVNKAKNFLIKKPYVDFYVPFEGELAVLNIVKTIIKENKNIKQLKTLHPEYFKGSCFVSNGKFINAENDLEIEDLNTIPSPFLTGLMDKFLETGIYPMIETTRACPFTCTFCRALHTKIRHFDTERIKKEIKYIAHKVPNVKKSCFVLADTNFGMYDKDIEIASFLEKIYGKTGFPDSLFVSTGKTIKDSIIKAIKNCSKLHPSMAVQTLDEKVLKVIKRKNFHVFELAQQHKEVDLDKKVSEPEIILGLPLETKKSHLQTMRKIIKEIKPTGICQYTLMLLPGTELSTDSARAKYKYNTRFRLVPTGFGNYLGKKCFEIEEVSVGTKDMSFKDYLEMREMFFFIKNIYGNKIFIALIKYLEYLNKDVIDFFLEVSKKRLLLKKDDFSFNIIEEYLRDTKKELFKTKKALIKYYSQNKHYQELLQGKEGANLAHTYKALVLFNIKEWTNFVLLCFREFVKKRQGNSETAVKLTEAIIKHIKAQAECQQRFFNKKGVIPSNAHPIKVGFDFDLASLPVFKKKKVVYSYFMNSDAIKFSTSFSQSQSPIEKALIILRSDPNYAFPVYKGSNPKN